MSAVLIVWPRWLWLRRTATQHVADNTRPTCTTTLLLQLPCVTILCILQHLLSGTYFPGR